MVTEKSKRGRPERYTRALADRICAMLAEGMSLRQACAAENMPPSTVSMWALEDRDGFSERYARAREIACDVIFDDLLAIADDSRKDIRVDDAGRTVTDYEAIQRARLRVDTRKFWLAKIAPRRFGDKQTVEHQGKMSFTIISGIEDEPNSRCDPSDPGDPGDNRDGSRDD